MVADARPAAAIIAKGKADCVAPRRNFRDDPRSTWHAGDTFGAD
jgi:hypothetical protein